MKPNNNGTFIAMGDGDDEDGDIFGKSNDEEFNFDFNSI